MLRSIPSVARLLTAPAFRGLIEEFGVSLITELLREELDRLREKVRESVTENPELARRLAVSGLASRCEAAAKRLLRPSPRAVINATGVVVHTNLGRSVLSGQAARRVAEVAESYIDLEFDLESGGRGSRGSHLEPLLARLFPGYAFHVVNNNAAAILLALRALARGREVILSRGELVEIGGSFRVPDILSTSGARLREVGTTNRTRLSDYESAISPRTAIFLKVHTSNFRIVGFSEETSIRDLSNLARRTGVPLIVDWGSGDLVDLTPLGIRDELPVAKILEEGADLVTFSGDKLLGGPQSGVVVGRADLVHRMRRDPLSRACRLDRLLTCALWETLAAYVRGRAFEEIPTLRMLSLTAEEVGRRAEEVQRRILGKSGAEDRIAVIDGVSRTGGGSSPAGERPTRLLSVRRPTGDAGPIERSLRLGDPPIIGRLHEGNLLIDLRTVLPDQDRVIAERLARLLAKEAGGKTPRAKTGKLRR